MSGTELRYTGDDWVLEQGTNILDILGDRSKDYDLVVDAIEALTKRDQKMINMFFYERLTYQEISDELKMKGRQYAYYQMKRTMKKLRNEIEKRGYEVGG